MKRIVLSLLILASSAFAFSSDVGDLLRAAQESYESGDLSTAVQKIDSAKKIIESEKLSSASVEYIELKSWDIVKLKKTEYIGKKVKVIGTYCGPNGDGTIYISNISTNNTYDESLVDELLSLKTWSKYTFYGTVLDDSSFLGPKLHMLCSVSIRTGQLSLAEFLIIKFL